MRYFPIKPVLSTAATLWIFVVALMPIVWVILLSVKPGNLAFDKDATFVFPPTLDNYQRLLADGSFLHYFTNSVVVAVGTVVLSMVIGAPAAYVISRSRVRRFVMLALGYSLFIRLIPPVIFVMPYFLFFRKVGLSDTTLGLIIAYSNLNIPLVMWSLWTYFNEVPRELDEAASIDGAGPFRTFISVVFPAAAPGVAATAIITFIMAWNEFLLALVLTTREAKTLPVAIMGFLSYEGADWGLVASGATLIMAPVVFFTFFIQKYLVTGLGGGAVRG